MAAVEVDPSIILKAQPPQFDPIGTAQKGVALGQGLLQNRLVQQQVQGKEALGRAVTQATDTTTGKTDWTKAQSYLAQDPQGAFAAPDFAAAATDRQIKQLELEGHDIDLVGKRAEKITNLTAGLLASKDPLTRDGVIKSLSDDLVGSGMFSEPAAIQQLTSFVQRLPTDDKGLRAALEKAYLGYGPIAERIAALRGTPSTVDTGGAVVQQQVSPLTGQVQVNATTPKTLDPGTASSPTPVMVRNADGSITPSAVTRQQFGDLAATGPVMTAPPLSREGLTPEMLNQQVKIVDPVTKKEKVVTLGSILPAMGGGGVATSLAPGEAAALTGSAATAVELAKQWTTAADQAPERIAQIKNLRDQVGRFTSGPQASWIYRAKALGTQLGLPVGDITNETAAQEEFAKLAQQFVNSNTQQLGEGTDSKLSASLKASPNEFMSKQGVTGVLALMEGLEAAKPAKAAAWQRWLAGGHGPESAQEFQTQWNQLYNPRVFQFDYMDPKQRATMLNAMTPKEQAQFRKDRVQAKQFGWIK